MSTPPQLRLTSTLHPLVYEVNTRVLVSELTHSAGKRVTLGTIPDQVLDEWAALGFDAIWLMGVWTTGSVGTSIAAAHNGLQDEYRRALPDVSAEDVLGSPYAVTAYTVSALLGGNRSLAALRTRLASRGLGLILDFIPNHTARDHAWVHDHPEYYVSSHTMEPADPELFFAPDGTPGVHIAFGKDPHYAAWTDTAQLNHLYPGTRKAMIATLKKISGMCDGVRCDMAMLVLEETFAGTWGQRVSGGTGKSAAGEFWADAIKTIRSAYPGFLFVAEVYWGKEWELQQLGFNFTYDKRLYDRLLREGATSVYDHLKAELAFQNRLTRFIENHDEPRAARVLSSDAWHCAAAVVMSTVPGMVLFHEGQLDGRRVRLPVQLGRRPAEAPVQGIRSFYERLLGAVSDNVFRDGEWTLLRAQPGWHENHTWRNFLTFLWRSREEARFIVVNYAPHNGQCYIRLSLEGIEGNAIELRDLMTDAVYVRDRQGLSTRGMYFDLPGYGFHIFTVSHPHAQLTHWRV